ncbi:ABC transporter substrate-binding protein [Phytoactinopolyspora halotolerans]|uniref:Extracellular solute-binding protein n=1 Tax=Phytoactinopolyspora halotolerans TaxID=1981512 RepID=A0A6L9SE65_9ACTN|nr:extracellular solute-binding protein [Phytoactinopolyspora halotolerans]NEE02904.1 extracellular solute-binding protein [Phytoactinopolyspora halotolerans]
MRQMTRRQTLKAAAVAAPTLGLWACGNDDSTGGDGGPVELRYAFWGGDSRAQMTQEMIDEFEAENADIDVRPDYSDFGAYWDKLATSVASGDAPDIITMGGAYPSEYAGRGSLLDLGQVSDIIDTDRIDAAVLDNGMIDGSLYALPTGVNTYAVVANRALFDEAGVDFPDDRTWTWDDFLQICVALSESLGDDRFGTQDATNHNTLMLWARQRGESLYTADGGLGISAESVAEWWELALQLRDRGGAPSATLTAELESQNAPEQTLIGTNSAGLSLIWSNVLDVLRQASGEELVLLKPPGESEGQPGTWLGPSMFYTISADSDHPEEAAELVDFMLNDPDAAEAFLTDRGLPVNPEVREEILDELTPGQRVEAEFLTRMESEVGEAPPPPPVGSSETALIVSRLNSEVLFDRLTPQEAAEQFVAETEAALGV